MMGDRVLSRQSDPTSAAGRDFVRSLYQYAEEGIEEVEADGCVRKANPALCRMLGYEESELIGTSQDTIIHPDDRARETVLLQKLFSGTYRCFDVHKRFVHRTGTPVWAAVTSSIVTEEKSQPYCLSIVRDISAHMHAEVALRDSEDRLRILLTRLREYEKAIEEADEMIAVVDREYRFVIANRAYLTYYKKTSEEVVGRPVADVVDSNHAYSIIKEKLERCFEGEVVRYETKCHYPGRGERYLIASHLPLETPTGINRVVCILQDITDRRKAEEALRNVSGRLLQAQEAERKHIARELHDDINQRLAMLAVSIQQFRDNRDLSPRERSGCIDKLFKETTEISSGVQSLSHRLHSASLDYLSLGAAVQGFCDELARHHKVKIDFVHRDVPGFLTADLRLALFRVVQEGLQNAIKYSGVRKFDVSLVGTQGQLELQIRDCGTGFSTDAAMNGHGLGLISMKERVLPHNGTISIVSKPKQGTEITVRVPIEVSESPASLTAA